MGKGHSPTAAECIAAIADSKGIKTTICKRIPCSRPTFDRALRVHPTVAKAFQAECSQMVDVSHSVLIRNIEIAEKLQIGGKMVDTSDAKWYLSRKGRDQGFGTDPAVQVVQTAVTLSSFRDMAARRLAQVEELDD